MNKQGNEIERKKERIQEGRREGV